MLNLSTLLLGVVWLLPAAIPTHEQTFTPQSIHFTGASDYTDDELTSAAGLMVGQTYTSDDLKRQAQQLMDIGIFDKISYKFDGDKLNYTVKMSSQAFPIQVSNLPLQAGKGLEAQLQAKVPLYRGTLPAQGLLLEAVRRTLEELLVGVGVHAQVGTELVEDSATHTTAAIRFSIVSQPVRVGTVKLEGVSDFLRPQIELNAKLSDVPFDSERSAADIERRIMDAYAGYGFAAAQVHAVRYGFPVTADGAIRVPYKVTVKEGRSYRLGTVALAGNLPLDPVEVDRLMASRTSFMPENLFLGSLVSQVEMELKGQGYLNCRVALDPHLDEKAGVANYTVEADLGQTERVDLVKSAGTKTALQNLMRP
jgi:outer membrane protein assembly factor BamA